MAFGYVFKIGKIVLLRARFQSVQAGTGTKHLANVPAGFVPGHDVFGPIGYTYDDGSRERYVYVEPNGKVFVCGGQSQVFINITWVLD